MPSSQYINPYIAGSAVKGAEMFFGREDIFDFIRRNLVGPHSNNPIVLYGQRRTGKTSVLYQLQRRLGTGYWCVFIDLHGLKLGGMGNLMRGIATAISANLRRDHQITVEIPNRAAFEAEPTSAFETLFLDQVLAVLGDNQLVFMLDEAVRLDEEVRAGRLEHEIFGYLRHLMQHSQRLNFIFSLGSGIEEMAKDYALLFNGSLYHRISFLKPQAARDLIIHPVRDHYQVTDQAVDRILQITSGHPYYTQLVCHCIFNAWVQNPTATIEAENVTDILVEAIELGSANLTYVWQDSSAEEQALMAGLAAAASNGGTTATAEEIRDAWRQAEVDVPSQEITRALRGLIAREVISGGDTYSFTVDLQRLWIDKHRRINWVKDDLGEAIAQWAVSAPVDLDNEFDPRRTFWEGHDLDPDPRGTYREESAGLSPSPDADNHVFVGLPPALQRRYTVLQEFPDPGAEADVLLVRDITTTGPGYGEVTLRVVKVYRRNMYADHAVWAKIQSLSSENIVRFVETGTSGGRDYEVMEYVPGGNLAQLARARGLMPLSTVTEVVRQISGALAELHGHGIVHRDLKPENVLVREAEPLDIVLTDFGLARAPEQSVVAASRTGTLAYLAPETLLSRGAQSSQARDWWALGMIVRELLTGTPPFQDMTEAGINQALLLRPVDLGGITDLRARVLCRGLLHRDPEERWGAREVTEWLAGGTPTVAEDREAEVKGIKPFVFQQVQYRERKTLARAFIRAWDEAARRYFAVMGTAAAASSSWRVLQEWLEQFRNVEGEDPEALNAMIDDQLLSPSLPPDVKLLILVQWLDPDLPPVYREQTLDPENLVALAERVAVDHDPDPRLARLVTDLHAYDLLVRLARMRDGGNLAEADERWRELDARFGRRALDSASVLTAEGRRVVMDGRNPRRQAALLYLALNPQSHQSKLRQHLVHMAPLLQAPVPWFDQIWADAQNRHDPIDDALLLALFPLAARDSAAADQARVQAEEVGRRNQERWAEQERQRLAGKPNLSRALKYSGIIAGAMLIMFIVSVALVHKALTADAIAGDIGNGLVGAVVAGLVVITEMKLATRLGSDYAHYPATGDLGRMFRRAGSHIHGAGRGCLLLFLLPLVLSVAFSAAFVVPAIGYAIIGVLHMRSWLRRRKAWIADHERERVKVVGSPV